MNFDGIRQRVTGKPPLLIVLPTVFFLVLIFLKWQLALPVDALLFFVGALLGMFVLDIAEEFLHLNPSPFRTIVFTVGLLIVGFYIITSTSEAIAKGLILSLTLTLLMFQLSEWKIRKSLAGWYTLFIGVVPEPTQKVGLVIFVVLFIIESVLFLM